MDSDSWASRLEAVKRQYNLHHQNHISRLDRLSVDGNEDEDEVRSEYPCPYCYEILDIETLCSHLEDEHSFDSRVAVCPICSSKVLQDMLSHIKVQHGHLFKMLRKIAAPSSDALSVLGRDLRDAHLQALLGSGGGYHPSNTSNAATPAVGTDPLLSSFISSEDFSNSVTVSNAEDTKDDATASATHMWKPSLDSSLSCEEREQSLKQVCGRVGFVQALILSTLVVDDDG